MKKLVALIAICGMFLPMSGATAATKIKVTPQFKVSKKNPVVTFKVSGLPKENGIYISVHGTIEGCGRC